MKIIIDARTTQDEIKYNGVGRYTRLIIEHLIKNYPTQEYILVMYDNPSTLDEFLTQNKSEHIKIVRIGLYDESTTIKMIKHNLDLFFNVRINKALNSFNTKDCVYFCPSFNKGFPIFRLPVVVTFHDFALPKFNIYSQISPIHNILRFLFYWRQLLPIYFAKDIIVDAKFTLNEVFHYLPLINKEKVHDVLLGVYEDKRDNIEFEKYLPKDFKTKGYLIYLGGGLTKNKNSEGVVNGYAQFIKKLKQKNYSDDNIPYLVIAGKNFTSEYSKDATNFRNSVKELGIEKYVHYTGMYDDYARWPLLKNSFGYIHLSLYEGFGIGVSEAMLAGAPVIAHNGSTYTEVVGDGAILVDGTNELEVSNAIMKIYNDKDFVKELVVKGIKRAKELDWNITAQKTYKILTK